MQELTAYAAKIDERKQRLLTMLREAPQTLAQLVAQRLLYPPRYESPKATDAGTRTISQHLDGLLADGGPGGRTGCLPGGTIGAGLTSDQSLGEMTRKRTQNLQIIRGVVWLENSGPI